MVSVQFDVILVNLANDFVIKSINCLSEVCEEVIFVLQSVHFAKRRVIGLKDSLTKDENKIKLQYYNYILYA